MTRRQKEQTMKPFQIKRKNGGPMQWTGYGDDAADALARWGAWAEGGAAAFEVVRPGAIL
jgi:hypothetical protein